MMLRISMMIKKSKSEKRFILYENNSNTKRLYLLQTQIDLINDDDDGNEADDDAEAEPHLHSSGCW